MLELRAAVEKSDWPTAADCAIVLGAKSLEFLPVAMAQGFRAIQDAFRRYESDQDDAARSALGSIGLTSPFLEWKLLLRGLMAYAAGDDGLALDNWRRISADRLPGMLAAPLRASLDAHFRSTLSPSRQQALQTASDKLRGGHAAVLRAIQMKLGRPEFLAPALNDMARLLPRLRRESPQLLPKLARACYAAATHGHPDGAVMLKALFDPPADDPTWSRLQALAAEMRGDWLEANRHWQHYQSVLSEHIGFGGKDRARARAMIWVRCAMNAKQQAIDDPRGPKPTPDAEGCYRRAIQLDADFVEASQGLFDLYCKSNRTQEALAVGRRLLEIAPDQPDIHRQIAELAQTEKNLDLAIEHLDRAQAANPFDRELSISAAHTLRQRARIRAMAGDLNGAETDLNAVEPSTERLPIMLLQCQRAALAIRAGDQERGRQLADEARAISVAAVWALLAETTHLKLRRDVRSPLERELTSVLYQKPVASLAADLAEVALDQERAGLCYRGFKAHSKKAQERAEYSICYRAPAEDFRRLCETLHQLKWWKPLQNVALHGRNQFSRDPVFYYWGAQAELDNPKRSHYGYAQSQLSKARQLAEERVNRDPAMRELLEKIAIAERRYLEMCPPLTLPRFLELLNV